MNLLSLFCRRVFAKPEHSLLHVETDSREEVLQSILFANRDDEIDIRPPQGMLLVIGMV